jgi:integrase
LLRVSVPFEFETASVMAWMSGSFSINQARATTDACQPCNVAFRSGKAKVFVPDSKKLEKLGFESVAQVPVIFDADHRYCREYNRYLRERATLDWSPRGDGSDYPRPKTLVVIAHHLANWINWCAWIRFDWKCATYGTVLKYQKDQERGIWSSKNEPLKPGTANARADEVTNFLQWASLRGLRPSFHFKITTQRRTIAGLTRVVTSRTGRAKEPATGRPFRLPSAGEVRSWLLSVRELRGEAKYLACRFVVEAGPRRSEVEQMKVSQWPSSQDIEKARAAGDAFVWTELRDGTKGGRPRHIRIPIDFASTVRVWIGGPRNTYVYRHYKKTGMRTDRLFVSDSGEHAGTPLSASTIYKCFRDVQPRPREWSPHKGRHAFACFLVLHALENEARANRSSLKNMSPDWINDRGRHWLNLLRRQFGHVSEETTEIYLLWLVTAAGLSQMASGWHAFLNSEDASA